MIAPPAVSVTDLRQGTRITWLYAPRTDYYVPPSAYALAPAYYGSPPVSYGAPAYHGLSIGFGIYGGGRGFGHGYGRGNDYR